MTQQDPSAASTYGEQQAWYGYSPSGSSSAGAPPRRSRPSGPVVAGILAAALFVGGFGGLAGSAAFEAVDHAAEGNAGGQGPVTSSTVVERRDTAARPGSVEAVANSVLPSVVKINVVGPQQSGSGSGIIVSSDGEILTNNHVVSIGGSGGSVTVSFNDGSSARARVIGTDPVTDLAVIKASGVVGLPPAKLGQSANVDVGEQVVAIGSPFGLRATVTSGIVSALNRPVSIEGQGSPTSTTYPAIQTDAAINPGNSGGPLVNMRGEVIGINSSIRTASSGEGGSIGLGFAIPLDKVLPIVAQLRAGQAPTHARLGVSVGDAVRNGGLLTGALIDTVNSGSSADRAGLRSGDVVIRVDGQPITDADSLVATIRGYRPGNTVTVTVVRDTDQMTVRARLDSDRGSPTS